MFSEQGFSTIGNFKLTADKGANGGNNADGSLPKVNQSSQDPYFSRWKGAVRFPEVPTEILKIIRDSEVHVDLNFNLDSIQATLEIPRHIKDYEGILSDEHLCTILDSLKKTPTGSQHDTNKDLSISSNFLISNTGLSFWLFTDVGDSNGKTIERVFNEKIQNRKSVIDAFSKLRRRSRPTVIEFLESSAKINIGQKDYHPYTFQELESSSGILLQLLSQESQRSLAQKDKFYVSEDPSQLKHLRDSPGFRELQKSWVQSDRSSPVNLSTPISIISISLEPGKEPFPICSIIHFKDTPAVIPYEELRNLTKGPNEKERQILRILYRLYQDIN